MSSSFNVNNQSSQEVIFVDETINNKLEPISPIKIKIPYPPPIKPEELVAPKKGGEVPSRSPNPFMIYRRLYLRELKAQNLTFKMADISSMASASWKLEPKLVKDAYFQIA